MSALIGNWVGTLALQELDEGLLHKRRFGLPSLPVVNPLALGPLKLVKEADPWLPA